MYGPGTHDGDTDADLLEPLLEEQAQHRDLIIIPRGSFNIEEGGHLSEHDYRQRCVLSHLAQHYRFMFAVRMRGNAYRLFQDIPFQGIAGYCRILQDIPGYLRVFQVRRGGTLRV